jgi:hypothetical protein
MTVPKWHIEMDYIECCNCNYACPCNFIGYPTDGKCQTMAGYHIRKGAYGDTSLDDVNLVMAASWPGAIHQGNGTVRLHIDESTSEAQRDAVMMIFSGQAQGNGPFELFSSTFSTIEAPVFATVDVHVDGRKSGFRVPGIIDVALEPFTNPVSGEVQDIQVHMPAGFIFKKALAAKTRVMKLLGMGPLSFDHSGQNAFFADVAYAGP